MKARSYSIALGTGILALLAFSYDANAATVTFASATPNYIYFPTLQPTPNDYTGSNTVQWNVTANIVNVELSPYGSIDPSSPYYNPNILSSMGNYLSPYSVINPGGATSPNGVATYNFSSGVTSFSFLWGSPDPWNSVQFFSGANGTGAIPNALFYGNNPLLTNCCTSGLNTNDVAVFDFTGTVGSVEFQDTGTPAFEYAIPTTGSSLAATPLPSTWTMLIAGFVGLGLFAYRGSKNRSAIAAA